MGGGDICDAYRFDAVGRTLFARILTDAPQGFFRAEAEGPSPPP